MNCALDIAKLKKADAVVISLEKTAQILLSALVILADWIASDGDKFLLRDIESCQSMEYPPERADAAWEALNLTPYWNVQQDWDDLYKRRFNIFDKVSPRVSPNPLQEKLLEIAKTCLAPGIVVVEAAMGEGKTEAALAAAEVLAHSAGRGGLLFALPTQATSNAMFCRVLEWIKRLDAGDKAYSVSLAHSKADFNNEKPKINLSNKTHV